MLQMDILRTGSLILLLAAIASASEFEECSTTCLVSKVECLGMCHDIYCSPSCSLDYDSCKNSCIDDYDSCMGICAAIDEDSDGINDINDSVLGAPDDISLTGLSQIEVLIDQLNATEPNASKVQGIRQVTITSDDVPVLEFENDFSASGLDLFSLEVIVEEIEDRHGVIINGLNQSKTIYLRKDQADGAICIKDEEIGSIEEISDDCMDEGELFFGRCDEGETIGDYSCSVVDGQYRIEGLMHSGAAELNLSGVYSGYFTVNYLSTAGNHKEGYLMPGEGIEICFESQRPIYDDENLRIIFVPFVGGITLNEVWTPQVVSTYNVHIYP